MTLPVSNAVADEVCENEVVALTIPIMVRAHNLFPYRCNVIQQITVASKQHFGISGYIKAELGSSQYPPRGSGWVRSLKSNHQNQASRPPATARWY
jgi:hypothetical protein